ncbi:hypothetical protein RchiOBHm_Chr3g0483941 [Rosa chinensis]|uniref:Uncharacterized protein n=1 Tax=Rosa chinensis TaxID=74649 RepID=A0A2P6REL2_ROSCH|nr:uncharacterized protein LOC112191662 [Rosa chinensis]XP_024186821.1 uncharacterized protein LOC112191662 [Rosa chinensis]XP_024186822.1 uncharacterized protein LOC112191662 [Rosa chinensis]PRQ44867.1 hypothetical protein RchiOBHm_Chr3g0483941 [Rosa chinensis]
MERKQDEVLHDKDENQTRNEEGVTYQIPVLKPFSSSPDIEVQLANAVDWGGGKHIAPSGDIDASGEVNMEASITPDDVIRAGGFGARDDISSFLPVASDSTDFEATIRDARDYEEPQGDICRPGLGWTKS